MIGSYPSNSSPKLDSLSARDRRNNFRTDEIQVQPRISESEFMEKRVVSATETHDSRPLPPAKTKAKNKQRFSDEQIRLLESTFESETKLEPRKKVAVAGELGLHPRQVAIWFQNRRARGKSKQIEQDLRILQANYDGLASQFEILKEEKQALLLQLQKLNGMADDPLCGASRSDAQPDSRVRHGLQDEVEEAAMDHSWDFQKSGIIKWMEDEGCEIEAVNPDEHEQKSIYNTLVEEEGRQVWGTQHLSSSMTSLSFDNSCSSSEWLHFYT